MSDEKKKKTKPESYKPGAHERKLLIDILSNPGSVIPKIAYAHWLAEQDEKYLAAFVFLKSRGEGMKHPEVQLSPEQRDSLQPQLGRSKHRLEEALGAVIDSEHVDSTHYMLNVYSLLKGEPFFNPSLYTAHSKMDDVFVHISKECGEDAAVSLAMFTRPITGKMDLHHPYNYALKKLDDTSFDAGRKLDIANKIADLAQEEGWEQLRKLAEKKVQGYLHEFGMQGPSHDRTR